MSAKSSVGNFFEDFTVGQKIVHATPRTIHGGDLSTYIALTGDRHPLSSSTEFARSLGYARETVHDLLVFHMVFGKSVPDISFNAVANLGYADVRFKFPVYPGDTLHAESEVIGLRETSGGDAGVVYVATRGLNQRGQVVLQFCRWVLVHKRDKQAAAAPAHVPTLPAFVPADDLPLPECLNLARWSNTRWATGGAALWGDYAVGERIHHVDGMTLEDADHMAATRLYHNTARVHFDAHAMASSRFGKRLVYGGHIISLAHALAYNGLQNVLGMVAWNSGSHVNPSFAGDTIYAWTDIVDKAEIAGRADIGALRMRLVAVKNGDPRTEPISLEVDVPEGKGGTKKAFDPRVVLVLDHWGIIPR